ncbi:SIMPL domain-containing protein [Sporichthya sp.]|uniref:SIMPL domain-containing protein n=1 Tax=Sporichthya sp. TaxID=65475 RepID=UPI0017D2E3D1|nr:SIMPL domain-containing protein [Sporichthya sp.]MBA3744989.1 SIMPL domain-containing protein [Sporichthya sp.]
MKRTLRQAAAPVAAAGIVGAVVAGFLLGNGSGSGVAADGAEPAQNTVSVAGTGKVSGIPDVLRLDMGVQHNGNDVNEALNAANSDVAKIKKALDKYDIDSKDIQTSQLSINPHYENNGKINGYEVFQGLTVKLRDLSKAGKAISDAAAAGGNATRINGVSFDIEDNAKLLQAARDAAFADAKAKAEQYAKLAGRGLGNVTQISEDTSYEGAPMPYAADMAAAPKAEGSVPLEAGSQLVSVNSSISWELV